MQFGPLTSTDAARVLSEPVTGTTRQEEIYADSEVSETALRNGWVSIRQNTNILECLLSIWLMRPLGGENSVTYLRMGKLNEPKTAANIWSFFC